MIRSQKRAVTPDTGAAIRAFRNLRKWIGLIERRLVSCEFQIVRCGEHHAVARWELFRGKRLVGWIRAAVIGFDPATAFFKPVVELDWGRTDEGKMEIVGPILVSGGRKGRRELDEIVRLLGG